MKTRLSMIKAALIGSVTAFFTPLAMAEMRPPPNPYLGMDGAAAMHDDTYSSDTSPLQGPSASSEQDLVSESIFLAAACPTIVIRKDGNPMMLCTNAIGYTPVVHLIDHKTGKSMASLDLPKGSLLGGVYGYLDNEDRMVLVDGDQNLVRVKASQNSSDKWTLTRDESVSLASVVNLRCPGKVCDSVEAINVGSDGAVWFVTTGGVLGVYDINTGEAAGIELQKTPDPKQAPCTQTQQEGVYNSFSTTIDGYTSVVTDTALYLLNRDSTGKPEIIWREEYDRGTHRKPGQLSQGSGATPTFFGPDTGSEYVTITDNSDLQENLLVYRTCDAKLVCKFPIFKPGTSGTENSAIAVGRMMVVASTYGYPYPKVPEGVPPAMPPTADLAGGIQRVDVRPDESGCDLVWENDINSSAVPKLSTADNTLYTIYTIERGKSGSHKASIFDNYYFTAMDAETGVARYKKYIGKGFLSDTLETAGMIGVSNTYWQGKIDGFFRISEK